MGHILDFFRRRKRLTRAEQKDVASSRVNVTTLSGLIDQVMEHPDDLVKQRGLRIFDEMMQTDPQVKAAIRFKQLAAISPGWEVVTGGPRPIDLEARDFIRDQIDSLDGVFEDVLIHILVGLIYGFSVNEKIFTHIERGQWAGKIGWARISDKPSVTFDFNPDDSGLLPRKKGGLVQYKKIVMRRRDLNPGKFIIWSYQREGDNWYGRSDLLPAFRYWFSNQIMDSSWNIYLERYGQPPIIGDIESSADKEAIEDFLKHLEALQQKSAMVLKKDRRSVKYLETTPGSSAVRGYKDRMDYNNRQISRAVLVPDLVFSEGLRVGSKALGTVHGQTFLWVVSQLGRQIGEVFTEQAVRELVAWNFRDAATPVFQIKAFTNIEALLETLVQMINADIVAPDESWIRERLNVPPADSPRVVGEVEDVGREEESDDGEETE